MMAEAYWNRVRSWDGEMRARAGRLALRLLGAVLLAHAFALPLVAADLPREIAARQLVDESAVLKSAKDMDASLAKLDLVLKDYPDTGAAMSAEWKRADILRRLSRGDDAVAAAEAVIAKYPKSSAASHARLGIAQTLLDAGEIRDGLRELVTVASGEPQTGSEAVGQARALLGPLCEAYLKDHAEVLDAADYLGVDRRDAKMKALVLATIAAHRGRDGRVDQARPLLERLERECPDQTAEAAWGKLRVASACLDSTGCQGEDARWATSTLRDICLPTSIVFEESSLWLARCYMSNHNPAAAAAVLQDAADRSVGKCSPRILYALASVLLSQNRREEADPVLKRVLKNEPVSSYAQLARFVLDHPEFRDSSMSLDRMIRRANNIYNAKWRVFASCPMDTWLDLPGMIAVQAVAMVREGFYELPWGLMARLDVQTGCSRAQVLRVQGAIMVAALQDSEDISDLMRKQPDVLNPLFGGGMIQHTPEGAAAHLEVLDSTASLVGGSDDSKLPARDRVRLIHYLGLGYMGHHRFQDALDMFREELRISPNRTTREPKLRFLCGVCCHYLGDDTSARSYLDGVIERYPDTDAAAGARDALTSWSRSPKSKADN